MTMIRKLLGAGALALGLAACAGGARQGAVQPASPAGPASATTAPAVSDLVGMPEATGGGAALVERGYLVARRQGMVRFWWHRASRSCLRVTAVNGRYRALEPATAADCGQ